MFNQANAELNSRYKQSDSSKIVRKGEMNLFTLKTTSLIKISKKKRIISGYNKVWLAQWISFLFDVQIITEVTAKKH